MRQRGVPMTTNPSAFTIVEALVATTILGIASAALVASLAANSHLRSRASAKTTAAQLSAERIGFLAARACTAPDSAGATGGAAASELWTARRSAGGWKYTDSIAVAPAFTFQIDGTVACRP